MKPYPEHLTFSFLFAISNEEISKEIKKQEKRMKVDKKWKVQNLPKKLYKLINIELYYDKVSISCSSSCKVQIVYTLRYSICNVVTEFIHKIRRLTINALSHKRR